MSAAVAVRREPREQPRLFALPGGRAGDAPARPVRTLDAELAGAWDGLRAGETVACPVCRGSSLRPRWSAGAGAVGGRCDDCGSTLD